MAGTRKGTYEIANWSKYNESLVQRGSITFWFSEDAIDHSLRPSPTWRPENKSLFGRWPTRIRAICRACFDASFAVTIMTG